MHTKANKSSSKIDTVNVKNISKTNNKSKEKMQIRI